MTDRLPTRLKQIADIMCPALVLIYIIGALLWKPHSLAPMFACIFPNIIRLAVKSGPYAIHWRIAVVGGCLNFLAAAANGWLMPALSTVAPHDGAHVQISASTHLYLLCDIFGKRGVVMCSLGDVLICLAGLLYCITRVRQS